MFILKEVKLFIRLISILSSILIVTVLIIKAPLWFANYFTNENVPPPPVATFGIHMPKGYSVHGIDVSKHQGTIDWKRVSLMEKNGIKFRFVYIKATEGISSQDKKFRENWKNSAQQGLLRGAYHFYYPSRDAGRQADNFISTVKLIKGDLPPVVDIEHSNSKSAAKICEGLRVFVDRIEKHYGVKPIIYTNIHFYENFLQGKFDKYPLWISCYFEHERFFSEFTRTWILWQHSEKGNVDGIRGNVDFNVFNGTLEQLRKKGIQ